MHVGEGIPKADGPTFEKSEQNTAGDERNPEKDSKPTNLPRAVRCPAFALHEHLHG